MKIEETNSVLRHTITELINAGWLKTHIGKILLGSNGQAHLNHFLKENDSGLPNDFGVKPLQKIAEVVDCDIHVTFVPKQSLETQEHLDKSNMAFMTELQSRLLKYFNNEVQVNKSSRQNKTQIDSVLDELFDDVI